MGDQFDTRKVREEVIRTKPRSMPGPGAAGDLWQHSQPRERQRKGTSAKSVAQVVFKVPGGAQFAVFVRQFDMWNRSRQRALGYGYAVGGSQNSNDKYCPQSGCYEKCLETIQRKRNIWEINRRSETRNGG